MLIMWRSTKIFHWQAANVLTSCDASFRIQGIITTEIAKLARVTDGAQTAAYTRRGSDLAARAQVGRDVGPGSASCMTVCVSVQIQVLGQKKVAKDTMK